MQYNMPYIHIGGCDCTGVVGACCFTIDSQVNVRLTSQCFGLSGVSSTNYRDITFTASGYRASPEAFVWNYDSGGWTSTIEWRSLNNVWYNDISIHHFPNVSGCNGADDFLPWPDGNDRFIATHNATGVTSQNSAGIIVGCGEDMPSGYVPDSGNIETQFIAVSGTVDDCYTNASGQCGCFNTWYGLFVGGA